MAEGSGEGDGFADVVEAADPGYYSLDAHAEAGVGDAAACRAVCHLKPHQTRLRRG